MNNPPQKSLLQKMEEAARKPVPYEGLVINPADAGFLPAKEADTIPTPEKVQQPVNEFNSRAN